MPEISVIMGVYNCSEEMLESSISSVLAQSFDDFELIICADGSDAATKSALERLAAKDSRIKLIGYDENRSLAYALNECLKTASGRYIARQDADDTSYPQRFAVQKAFLDGNSDFDFVGCCADVFDDEGVWGSYPLKEQVTKRDFLWNSPFLHPTVMFRREALERAGGYRVAKSTRVCEDYDLFMRLYALGKKGYNLKDVLYAYRYLRSADKKRRPMKYRVDEMKVRARGFAKLKMPLSGLPFVFKPILVGLIPQKRLNKIKSSQFSDKNKGVCNDEK